MWPFNLSRNKKVKLKTQKDLSSKIYKKIPQRQNDTSTLVPNKALLMQFVSDGNIVDCLIEIKFQNVHDLFFWYQWPILAGCIVSYLQREIVKDKK